MFDVVLLHFIVLFILLTTCYCRNQTEGLFTFFYINKHKPSPDQSHDADSYGQFAKILLNAVHTIDLLHSVLITNDFEAQDHTN